MPKMKTNRGAAKRFKRTASGGFKRAQSHRRHILTKKSTKRKRHLREPGTLQHDVADAKALALQCDKVDPATTALASGGRSELVAYLTHGGPGFLPV